LKYGLLTRLGIDAHWRATRPEATAGPGPAVSAELSELALSFKPPHAPPARARARAHSRHVRVTVRTGHPTGASPLCDRLIVRVPCPPQSRCARAARRGRPGCTHSVSGRYAAPSSFRAADLDAAGVHTGSDSRSCGLWTFSDAQAAPGVHLTFGLKSRRFHASDGRVTRY
jgi:hypothetical protein